MDELERCPWAIKFGVGYVTRCLRPADHEGTHEGGGLAQYPEQRVEWYRGDRREFTSDRADVHSWKEPVDAETEDALRQACHNLGIPYP